MNGYGETELASEPAQARLPPSMTEPGSSVLCGWRSLRGEDRIGCVRPKRRGQIRYRSSRLPCTLGPGRLQARWQVRRGLRESLRICIRQIIAIWTAMLSFTPDLRRRRTGALDDIVQEFPAGAEKLFQQRPSAPHSRRGARTAPPSPNSCRSARRVWSKGSCVEFRRDHFGRGALGGDGFI